MNILKHECEAEKKTHDSVKVIKHKFNCLYMYMPHLVYTYIIIIPGVHFKHDYYALIINKSIIYNSEREYRT